MNRKKLFIIFTLCSILLLALFILLISGRQDKKEGDSTTKIETQNVIIEDGLETFKDMTVAAVESYAKQDVNETASERTSRLKKIFAQNSTVYDKKLELTNDVVYKTSAKVTRIKHLMDSSEGVQKVLAVYTTLTCYYSGGTYEINKTFWLSLAEQSDGLFIPMDAGEYSE